jgi:iron complex outermembrane recepter protein
MHTSPRFSFHALVLACTFGISTAIRGQQPPAADTAARSRQPHRLAPQRITGTRLAPADSASRSVAARVEVLTNADVKSVAPGPAAVAQLLSRLNGVSVFDDQGTRAQPTIDLRGWTLSPVVGVAQGVSVFLDGVRINEADAQEVNFDLVPTEAIESASIVRGPIALYGKNTLAGAVLLTTKRGDDAPGVDAGVSTGRFGYRDAHLLTSGVTSSPVGRLDALLLARGSEESGFRALTPANTRLLFANIGRRSENDEGADVALSVLYAHDRLYQAGSLPESWLRTDPRLNYTPGDFFAPDLLHAALRGAWPFGAATLRGNAFVRHQRSQQFNVNIDAPSSRAHVDATTPGATIELDAPLPFAALTVGLEGSHDAVRYRVAADPTPNAPTIPDECDPTGLCENARVGADNAGIFGQLVFPLVRGDSAGLDASPLSLTISGRGDYVRTAIFDLRDPENNGASSFRRVSPRAALAYQRANASAYVAVNTAFRTPAPLELACADESAPCVLPFSLGDDPPLAPVTVLSYEAGADWSPWPWLATNLGLYRSKVQNEIVFAASSRTAGYFRNIPRTSRQGVELSLRAERRRPGTTWRLSGQYALVDARYRSSVQLASALPNEPAVTAGDRLPLSPLHRATADVGFTIARRLVIIDADLRGRATSSQLLRGDEANTQTPLPGYATAAAHLSARRDRFTLALDVDNLLNARFATFGTFAPDVLAPTPGGSTTPPVARFLTPGYPRALTISLSATW